MRKNSLYLIGIFTFFYIVFLFLYYGILVNFGFIPVGQHYPILIIIGFTIIIIVIFYFFLFKGENNDLIIKFKMLNENIIQIVLLSLMIITYIIPPISFTQSIIAWSEIGFLNYFRAVIFIIGSAYLPGMSIFNIAFPKSKLHERFHVESFMIKFTIYPLLSFSFLGVCTIILDYFGLTREYFSPILLLIIVILVFTNILFHKGNFIKDLKENHTEINISKNTTLILFLVIGVILINLGIQLSTQYLIEGDAWRGIQYAYFIGDPRFESFWASGSYSRYWGYISFSLSSLSGIPYLNTNVLLFPFVYLWVFSTYLMVKAILYNFKESYSILATILITTYSGLFYPLNSKITIPSLISNGIFIFDFKAFSYIFFAVSVAVYLIITKTSNNFKEDKKFYRKEEFLLFVLIAFLLAQGFMIYFLPIIPAFSLLFIYTFFSNNSSQNLKNFRNYWTYFIIFVIIFDVFSNGFISYFSMNRLYLFSGINFFQENKLNEYVFYLILLISLILLNILYFILRKFNLRKNKKKDYISSNSNGFYQKTKAKKKIIFKSIIFSILIILSIEILITSIIINSPITFSTFYLYQIFLNIGYIGIIGIFASHFCFKKNRKLCYKLVIWTIFLIGLASTLIFVNWMRFPLTSPVELAQSEFDKMMFWFNRIWQYSIISLSIFSSIGIIHIIKDIKIGSIKDLYIRKTIATSVLIFLSLSNTILVAMYYHNLYYKSPEVHDEVQMIGWVSENVPYNSNIIVEDLKFKNRLRDISFCNIFYLYDVIDEANRSGEKLNEFLASKGIHYYINKSDPYRLVDVIYKNKLFEYGTLAIYYADISDFFSLESNETFNTIYNFRYPLVGYIHKR